MRIKEMREAANLTQETVAIRLGISQTAVSHWESGHTKRLTKKLQKPLAKLYNVSIDEINAAFKDNAQNEAW